MKTIYCYLLAIALSLGLMSCGKLDSINNQDTLVNIPSQLSETAPPELIRNLAQNLNSYNPKVNIVFPQPGTKLRETEAKVQISVEDFPLFKDEELGLGFNLHLVLDNEPYIPLYSVEEPIKLENLAPGTHTLRVFACLPWNETWKTQDAYAQTTFSVLTETEDNYPQPDKPLLTYNEPTGNYGGEPIMLDFQINEPSQNNLKSGDTLSHPVKVTINDESFIVEQWQPIYLKGFKEGNNLIKLELLDWEGSQINNAFNNTVRLITYQPNSSDPLAKIVTSQISLEKAQAIIDPDYYDKLAKESTPEEAELPIDNKLTPEDLESTPEKPELSIDNQLIPEDSESTAKVQSQEESESNEAIVEESESENLEINQPIEPSVSAKESKPEVEVAPVIKDTSSEDIKIIPQPENEVIKDLEVNKVESTEKTTVFQ